MCTNNNITSTNTIFLFCKAPDGEGITIGDVRNWLERVDLLKLPESTELEGALYLSVDYENSLFSRISCGECLPQCNHEDLLVETPHTPL
jgi:hypothetical protein